MVQGLIDRRILVNFRIDPEALGSFLPAPFAPKTISGHGIAGVCLIRLKDIRPRRLPAFLGVGSENAAHRVAVVWDDGGERREGVYVPRRDTSSRLNTVLGGRLFPGEHHLARFEVREEGDRYAVALRSRDGSTSISVRGRVADALPADSIFTSIDEASEFFEKGSLGYSSTRADGRFDGLELRSFDWRVEPLAVESVVSTFFSNRSIFPPGSVEFDCALLMRGIAHEWHARETLCCA